MGIFAAMSGKMYEVGAKIVIDDATAIKKLTTIQKLNWAVKKSFEGVGQTVKAVGQNLASFAGIGFAGVAYGGLKAVQSLATFEEGLAKVQTMLAPGQNAMAMYGDAVKAMSIESGQSVGAISEALFQALSAGVSSADAMKFMGQASKSATGGFTTMVTAVDGLTNILNAYGLGADRTMDVSNAMFAANKTGKTTFEELSKSVGKVTPLAAAAGVGFEEVLSSIGSITKVGINTAETVTGLKATLAAIIKPSKEASDAAKQYGVDLSASSLKEKGWMGFLEDVGKKTGGDVAKIAKIFGSIEAANAVLALTSESGLASFKQTMTESGAAFAITDKAYKDASGSTQFSLNQIKAAWDVAMVEIGKAVMDAFGLNGGKMKEKLTGWIKGATDAIKGLIQFAKEWLPTFADLVVMYIGVKAGGALMQFGGSLSSIAATMIGGFGPGMVTAIGKVATSMGAMAAAAGVAYVAFTALFDLIDSKQAAAYKQKMTDAAVKGNFEAIQMAAKQTPGGKSEFMADYLAKNEAVWKKTEVKNYKSGSLKAAGEQAAVDNKAITTYNAAAYEKTVADAEKAYQKQLDDVAKKNQAAGFAGGTTPEEEKKKIAAMQNKLKVTIDQKVTVGDPKGVVKDVKTEVHRGAGSAEALPVKYKLFVIQKGQGIVKPLPENYTNLGLAG